VAASVRDYASNHPDEGYDSLVARFGAPAQIARACVENMDSEELLEELHVRRRIFLITLISAMTVIVLWLGVVSSAFIYNMTQTNGSSETYIEVFEENEE